MVRLINFLALSASIVTLSACTAAAPRNLDDAHLPDFAALGAHEEASLLALTQDPAAQWWQVLDDEVLTGLITTAFADNRDLKIAARRLQAARARLGLARTQSYPIGEVSADLHRRQISGTQLGTSEDGPESDYAALGLNAQWELDVFGRIASLREAAYQDLQSQDWLTRQTRAMIAAETARAFADYRGAQAQLDVAQRNRDVQVRTRDIAQTRLDEGFGEALDLARAEAQLATTQAAIAPFESARIAALYRLATLTGLSAHDVEARLGSADTPFIATPRNLAIGDITGLMHRRADIQAAEARLIAASAHTHVAWTDYFPRLSLMAGVTSAAEDLDDVGQTGTIGYSFGPHISWAGFNIARVKAGVEIANASAEEALLSYEQTVMSAIEETQSALSAYGREQARADALTRAASSARDAADMARTRYEGGVDDFIDVLDAESRLLSAEAALASSKTEALKAFIAVHNALGTGWQA
ncbi:efflux transporter outer membrane subunit [Woodsholea maritima]|uniref:efflux transporter outer membrane subunit n=1 Tax=Woodsholea maritima TaxID=240237 RepID=UPI000379E239|nr:TolC family protein [Woodsholea maritima]